MGKNSWFPAVSPDHASVAYWSNVSGAYELWRYDLRTQQRQQLTFFNQDPFRADLQNFNVHNAPTWSPDSKRIIFSHSGNLWIIDAQGFNLETLTAEGVRFSPAWSPDGTVLAYVVEDGPYQNLYLRHIDTNEEFPLTHFPPTYRLGGPVWSPDGKRMAFTLSNAEAVDIWIIQRDGRALKRLTSDGFSNSPAWSPDNSKLAFSSGRQDPYRWEIWVMNQDGTGQFSITRHGGYSPVWLRRNPLTQSLVLPSRPSAPLPAVSMPTPLVAALPARKPTAVVIPVAKQPVSLPSPKTKPVRPIQPTATRVVVLAKTKPVPSLQPTAQPTAVPAKPIAQRRTKKNVVEKTIDEAVEEAIEENDTTGNVEIAGYEGNYEEYEEYADEDVAILPQDDQVSAHVRGNQVVYRPHLEFYFAKDLIKTSSLPTLKELAENLNQHPDAPLVVQGSIQGPAWMKTLIPILKSLSRARANSVLRHLIVNEKIRQINVAAIGEGDPFPDLGKHSADRPVLLVVVK